MYNPFLGSSNDVSTSKSIKVNNKAPNSLGNILITIDDIPDLANTLNNKQSGDQAVSKFKVTDINGGVNQFVDVSASTKPNIGDSLVADSTSTAKWTKVNHDFLDPLTKGTLSHSAIDAILGKISPMIDNSNKIKISSISEIDISNTILNNQAILYNSTTSKWENKIISHDYLSNKGSYSHSDIDSVINSIGMTNGIPLMDSNKKIKLENIPSIAITNIYTVSSTTEMSALPNIHQGDVCIIINQNDNQTTKSYIFSTVNWIELTTFYQPTNLSSLTDVQFSTIPSNGNILQYNNNKWRNVSSLDTSLFTLSSPVNRQVTFSLSNLADNAHVTCYLPSQDTKLIGNNSIDAITNKTIVESSNTVFAAAIRSGIKTLSPLEFYYIVFNNQPQTSYVAVAKDTSNIEWRRLNHTDLLDVGTNKTHTQIDAHINATSGVHGVTGFVVGTIDIQTLMNKTFVDVNTFFQYGSTESKTVRFDLSNVTTNRIITIPDGNFTLLAPSNTAALGQILGYTSTGPTWQTLSGTTRIQDCTDYILNGILTDGDALIYNSQTQKFKNSNVVTAIQSQMKDLTASSLKTKIQNNVPFNYSYDITYNDGIDGNFMFINGDDPYYYSPVDATCNKTINIGSDCVYSQNTDWNMSTTTYVRVNILFDDIFQTTGVSIINNGSSPTSTYIRIYGSNTDSDYTSSNLTIASTCVSLSSQQTYTGNAIFIRTSDTNLYKYIIVLFLQGQAYNYLSVKIKTTRINGGFIPLSTLSDFNIYTNTNSGYPLITSRMRNTCNVSCNLQGLAVYELYRRIYPVIRSKDTINLYNAAVNNNCTINYNDSGNLALGNTVTIDSTGKIACYALGTTSIDLSGHGDIRLNSTGNKWDIGVYSGDNDVLRFNPSYFDAVKFYRDGTIYSNALNNHSIGVLVSSSCNIINIGTGGTNQVLMSNGADIMPSWQNNNNILQYDRFSVFGNVTNQTITTFEVIPWANNYFGYRMELDNATNRALYIQTCMPFRFDGGDFFVEILVNNGLNSDANGKTVTFSAWFNNLAHNGSLQSDSTTVNFDQFGWAKPIISFKNPNQYGVGISPHLFMLKIIRAYSSTWYFDTVWIAGVNIVYKQNSFGMTTYP